MKPNLSGSVKSAPNTLLLSQSKTLIVLTTVLFLAFVWMAWFSQTFPAAFNKAEVGAARVPLIAAIGGMLSTASIIAHTLWHKYIHKSDANYADVQTEIKRPSAIFFSLILIIAWVAGMSHIGFYATSAVIVPLIMLAGGERRPQWLLLSAIGFCLFVHLCFVLLLNIEFP